jgi:ankyrin repeat protein
MIDVLRAAGGRVTMPSLRLAESLVRLALLGRMDKLHMFLKAGVDVNICDHSGRTLLHWAVATGFTELERSLRALGIDASRRDHDGLSAEDLRGSQAPTPRDTPECSDRLVT